MDWETPAARLATQVAREPSQWHDPVASTPRHRLVPRWWQGTPDGWRLRDGAADEAAWVAAAYRDRTLVTKIGPLHADHAHEDDRPEGRSTSSSTMPGLVVDMLRHARIAGGMDVLEVGTGTAYSTAVLCHRLGDEHVTSIDVDPYLTQIATKRLGELGLQPRLDTVDTTRSGPIPGTYDRLVSTVAVRPIPSAWLAALRPGGRLVTTINGTAAILTADKTDDGGAAGRIEWDRAGFMGTRSGPDYPPPLQELLQQARQADGEEVSTGRYPVVNVMEAWDLWTTLGVTAPGIEHHFFEREEQRTAIMLHPDGSWARAVQAGDLSPTVHQAGPRRLWDLLDDLRTTWLRDGSLPVYGARVTITPDGVCHLRRGRWSATIE